MAVRYSSSGKVLPVNKDAKDDVNKDKLLRYLDCAVIEHMHNEFGKFVKNNQELITHPQGSIFDSVRGAFLEGGPAFKGSGIHSKTHIQICIRNPNCIRALFKPKKMIRPIDALQLT